MTSNLKNRIAQAKRFLNYLHPDKDTVLEIRMLGPAKPFSPLWQGNQGTPVGYYQNRRAAIKDVFSVDSDKKICPKGIYVTLNKVSDDLLGRANHRLRASRHATSDEEIICYQNLPIDIDPVRHPGINSSKEELQAAEDLAAEIWTKLAAQGWPEPYYGISGNGTVLIYKLPDLPINASNIALIKNFHASLSSEFSTDAVEVDASVYNPSRLVRLPGTKNRKGEDIKNRPQRFASIISIPKKIKPVSMKLLSAVASGSDAQTSLASNKDLTQSQPGTTDFEDYLDHYNRVLHKVKTYGDSKLYVLEECVFDPEHRIGKAWIGVLRNGTLYYRCKHDSCNGNWKEARKIISGDDDLREFKIDGNNPQNGDVNANEMHAGNDSNVEVVTFADILKKPKDKKPAVIEGILRLGESLLITGPTAIGKSTLLLHACLSLATGSRFLTVYETGEPTSVLLIQSENGFWTFRDRVEAMTHDWTGQRAKALRNIFSPWQNEAPQLVGSIGDERGNPTGFSDTVSRLIERTQAKIILFDPLISYHSADENDNTAMRKTLDNLSGVANAYDLTIIITHHHGKFHKDGYHKARGASAITDWASAILTLNKINTKDGRHLIKASWNKVRSFRPPDPLKLELVQGSTFRLVGETDAGLTSQNIETVLSKAENQCIAGRPNMIQAIRNMFQVGRDRAQTALNKAIGANVVIKETDPEDRRRRIYRLPTNEQPDSDDEVDIEDLIPKR
jgi:hypothetical protein